MIEDGWSPKFVMIRKINCKELVESNQKSKDLLLLNINGFELVVFIRFIIVLFFWLLLGFVFLMAGRKDLLGWETFLGLSYLNLEW